MDILVTKRLTLRPPLEVDIDDIAEFIGNWNVARMLARVPHPYFPKDAEGWIGHVSKNIDAGLDMAFTIHRERLIGIMSLEGFDGGAPEFGYWLAEPWWGKGFATEAAVAVLAHAFRARDTERVVSGVFRDNPASLHVQKKLGFKLTGSGPLWSQARGEMVEHVMTELTRRDFVAAGHAAAKRSEGCGADGWDRLGPASLLRSLAGLGATSCEARRAKQDKAALHP